MKSFSFFKNRRHSLSNIIRADQIASFLIAKINPDKDYENDICIYVKRTPPVNYSEKTYLDIIDQPAYIPWLLKNPLMKVIVTSAVTQKYLFKILRNDIFLIHQHHCNYFREVRDRDEVKVVGIIGSPEGECSYDGLVGRFREIGLDLIICRNPRKRYQVINFYKKIDIQIAYRPQVSEMDNFRTSLKLVNASSFGVPTVAYPEKSYVEEFGGCFLPAFSEDDLFINIKRLKEEFSLYEDLSEKAKERTEKYHIGNIGKLYQQLS